MKHGKEEKAYNVYLNGTFLYTTFSTVSKKTRTQREKQMKKILIETEGCDTRILVSESENSLKLHA